MQQINLCKLSGHSVRLTLKILSKVNWLESSQSEIQGGGNFNLAYYLAI